MFISSNVPVLESSLYFCIAPVLSTSPSDQDGPTRRRRQECLPIHAVPGCRCGAHEVRFVVVSVSTELDSSRVNSFQPLSNVKQHLCGLRMSSCVLGNMSLMHLCRYLCVSTSSQHWHAGKHSSVILVRRHDPSRSVIAHHYCTHLHGKNMHQCLIFDSDTPVRNDFQVFMEGCLMRMF